MKKKPRETSGNAGKSRGEKPPVIPGDPLKAEQPQESGTSEPKTPGGGVAGRRVYRTAAKAEPVDKLVTTTAEPQAARMTPPGKSTRKRGAPAQRLKCGAKARTTGQPCQKWAIMGRTRCRLHGGKSRRGMDAPAWKHGFFSEALPADVAALARRAESDPQLRDMRGAIAIGDVRTRELLASLPSGGTGSWDAAARALKALRSAAGDLNATQRALDDLRDAVEGGRTVESAWKEIRELFQERDRLLTGEVNRHKVTADMINADRVAAFMVGMLDALQAESDDPALVRRVFAKWERLMNLAGVSAPAGRAAAP